ncbi:hypothetical protein VCR31J2_1280079 [Vibrio coralliirubri]|uniref:Uncharacterized protein n=1 Tax=Vibrio coralliirubri TaxID=1516159 RepID=A0AA86X074_9VIBR|nr:hypothetical protein VCR31J2_1280079 [Vibrio coralliirubri]
MDLGSFGNKPKSCLKLVLLYLFSLADMPAFEVAMVLPPETKKLTKRLMVIDTCN